MTSLAKELHPSGRDLLSSREEQGEGSNLPGRNYSEVSPRTAQGPSSEEDGDCGKRATGPGTQLRRKDPCLAHLRPRNGALASWKRPSDRPREGRGGKRGEFDCTTDTD